MQKRVLYIGGSPCSGKSTVAGGAAARREKGIFRVSKKFLKKSKKVVDK